MKTRLLTLAAFVCILPHVQADSVFNFDNDPIGPTSGFTDSNNGISAAFNPGPFYLNIATANAVIAQALPTEYFPFSTLSGNVLETVLSVDQIISGDSPALNIAFSSELNSLQFNFGFTDFIPSGLGNSDLTVNAYNNGVLVGSETAAGQPPQPLRCCLKINPEGIGGFTGAPFNEVTITANYFNFEIDNLDVDPSTSVREPTALPEFAFMLVAAGIAYRRKSASRVNDCLRLT